VGAVDEAPVAALRRDPASVGVVCMVLRLSIFTSCERAVVLFENVSVKLLQ